MLYGVFWGVILGFDIYNAAEQSGNSLHVLMIAIEIVEKLHRLHKFNRLEREQRALRESITQAQAEIASLSARVERNEAKAIELETRLAQQEHAVANSKATAGLAPSDR